MKFLIIGLGSMGKRRIRNLQILNQNNSHNMQKVQAYINKNKQRFLDELIEILKIPSISADPDYKDDVFKTADYTAAN